MKEIVIITAVRTAIGKFQGALKPLSATQLGSAVVKAAVERAGVAPEQVIEVMGLMGDSTDNIPGVRGIGEKTAIALIQRYHSIENLFSHLDDLDQSGLKGVERIRKALLAGKEAAFLSRTLATVISDVPIRLELDDLRYQGGDKEKLQALFSELGFTHLVKALESQNANAL